MREEKDFNFSLLSRSFARRRECQTIRKCCKLSTTIQATTENNNQKFVQHQFKQQQKKTVRAEVLLCRIFRNEVKKTMRIISFSLLKCLSQCTQIVVQIGPLEMNRYGIYIMQRNREWELVRSFVFFKCIQNLSLFTNWR